MRITGIFLILFVCGCFSPQQHNEPPIAGDNQDAIQTNVNSLIGGSIAKIDSKIQSLMDANIQLHAKLDTMAAAQVGIGNKVQSSAEEIKNNFKAGGDVSQVQFNREMLDALRSANNTLIWTNILYALIVIIIIIVVATVLVRSHKQTVLTTLRAMGRDPNIK